MWRLIDHLKGVELEDGDRYKIIEIATEIAKADGLPLLLTLEEAAEYSGIGICKLRELSKKRDFPKIQNGNRTLVIKKDLPTWIGRHKGNTL